MRFSERKLHFVCLFYVGGRQTERKRQKQKNKIGKNAHKNNVLGVGGESVDFVKNVSLEKSQNTICVWKAKKKGIFVNITGFGKMVLALVLE